MKTFREPRTIFVLLFIEKRAIAKIGEIVHDNKGRVSQSAVGFLASSQSSQSATTVLIIGGLISITLAGFASTRYMLRRRT